METLPAPSVNNDPHIPGILPIYEYYWTIGISDYLHSKFVKDSTNIVRVESDKLQLSIPAVSTGATLLNTLARVPITSLPPVDGLSWDVKKVTGHKESEIMEGIQWTLPKKLFYVPGNRVTGSIAVYFHPAHGQHNEAQSDNQLLSNKLILAEAEAYDGNPPSTTFGKKAVELEIEPQSITDWQQATADLPPLKGPDHDPVP